jgi:tetratricopeptide (TPR) repeat protein
MIRIIPIILLLFFSFNKSVGQKIPSIFPNNDWIPSLQNRIIENRGNYTEHGNIIIQIDTILFYQSSKTYHNYYGAQNKVNDINEKSIEVSLEIDTNNLESSYLKTIREKKIIEDKIGSIIDYYLENAFLDTVDISRSINYLNTVVTIQRENNYKDTEISLTLSMIASVYSDNGLYEESKIYVDSTLKVIKELDYTAAKTYSILSDIYLKESNDSLAFYYDSLAHSLKVKVLPPLHNDLIGSNERLGRWYAFHFKNYDKGRGYFNKAVKIREANGVIYDHEYGRVLNDIGNCNGFLGSYLEALENFKKSKEVSLKLNDQEYLAYSYHNIAYAYDKLSYSLDSILPYIDSAISIANDIFDNQKLSEYYSFKGAVLVYHKHYDEAIIELNQALDFKKATPQLDDNYARLAYNLSVAWNAKGNDTLAIFYGKKELDVTKKIYGSNSKELINCYHRLGIFVAELDEFADESLVYIDSAIHLLKMTEIDTALLGYLYSDQANILYHMGSIEKALKLSFKALSVSNKSQVNALSLIAFCYSSLNQLDSAISYFKKYEKLIFLEGLDNSNTNLIEAYSGIIDPLIKTGKIQEAKTYFNKALLLIDEQDIVSSSKQYFALRLGIEAQKLGYFIESKSLIEKSIQLCDSLTDSKEYLFWGQFTLILIDFALFEFENTEYNITKAKENLLSLSNKSYYNLVFSYLSFMDALFESIFGEVEIGKNKLKRLIEYLENSNIEFAAGTNSFRNCLKGSCYSFLGSLYLESEQTNSALFYLKKSIEINNSCNFLQDSLFNLKQFYSLTIQNSYLCLASFFEGNNQIDSAVYYYDKVLEYSIQETASTTIYDIYDSKANALYEDGRINEAILVTDKLINHIDNEPALISKLGELSYAYELKGIYLKELKNYKKAIKYLSLAIELGDDFENLDAYMERSFCNYALGNSVNGLSDRIKALDIIVNASSQLQFDSEMERFMDYNLELIFHFFDTNKPNEAFEFNQFHQTNNKNTFSPSKLWTYYYIQVKDFEKAAQNLYKYMLICNPDIKDLLNDTRLGEFRNSAVFLEIIEGKYRSIHVLEEGEILDSE